MAEKTASQTASASDAPRITLNFGRIQRDLLLRRVGRFGLYTLPLGVYLFLWFPILVLIIFSFNDSGSVSVWRGFTVDWYLNIFTNAISAGTESARFQTELLLQAVRNSLLVATLATLISSAIGTLLALSLVRGRYPGKKWLDGVLYLPVVIPDVTQGVSLAVFFSILFDAYRSLTGERATPGFGSIIIAHVAFNISFVTIVVRARLAAMNPRLEEAARDLGANEWRTFWRVTFPLLLPGILAGGLLAFTLSLDDFVVTFFTSGVGTTTLPVFVYGMLKQRVPPEINAISTLMILASMLLVGVSLVIQARSQRTT